MTAIASEASWDRLIETLPSDHVFRRWTPSKPPWQMARHLFSNSSLENIERKWRDFCVLRETPETTESAVLEASWLAELEAYWILTRHLGFDPSGVEVSSPHGQDKNKRCDFGGSWRGGPAYVEVKCRAREDRERVPRIVHMALSEMEDELGYSLTPSNLDGSVRFDDATVTRLRSELRQHVESWRSEREKLGFDIGFGPMTFGFRNEKAHRDVLSIMFSRRTARSYSYGELFSPLSLEEIETWLFGRAADQPDGKVAEALFKGANVLAVRIATFLELEEIRNRCFPGAKTIGRLEYEIDDPRLSELQSVLLFSQWDEYELLTGSFSEDARAV